MKALLISAGRSVIEIVREVVGSIEGLNLEVVPDVEGACVALADDVVLVLGHFPHGMTAARVARLLQAIDARKDPIPVLVLNDEGPAEPSRARRKLGVVASLTLPGDLERLGGLVNILTAAARAAGPPASSQGSDSSRIRIVGENSPFYYAQSGDIGPMMEQVRSVAPLPTTVLLTGETGTGKTHLARLIHDRSGRSDQPFVVVNCAALSAGLIESEMFGHQRGAFTGADRDRVGKFGESGRGTLLLDEIDSLPRELQAKLLHIVEARSFEPVGSNRTMPFEARLIAASNRNLEGEVAAGRFRADLYYRLNVVGFTLPPLRSRPWMIAPIAESFLAKFATRNGMSARRLSPEAMDRLQRHRWPGNVRELRNVIERAVALSTASEIRAEDLPTHLLSEEPCHSSTPEVAPATRPTENPNVRPHPGSLRGTKEEAEAARISEVLGKHRHHRQRTAAELGISRMTLYKKLHKYGFIRSA
jgi:two-component system response regulator HydG